MESKYYKQALEEYNDRNEGESDSWDERIRNTGCYIENMALQLCHAETNDWRKCFDEMALFKQCWKNNGNNERVNTKDQ